MPKPELYFILLKKLFIYLATLGLVDACGIFFVACKFLVCGI